VWLRWDTDIQHAQSGSVLQLVECRGNDNEELFIKQFEFDCATSPTMPPAAQGNCGGVPKRHIGKPSECGARLPVRIHTSARAAPAPCARRLTRCNRHRPQVKAPTVETKFECVYNEELLLYLCLQLDPSISKIARAALLRVSRTR
jgi:hypothetical protein